KVTPAHDTNDYEIGQRHGLEVIDILNPDGTINELTGWYAGQDRAVARKQAGKDLAEMGLLVKKEPYTNSVGHSERTDAVIEPRLSLQWFLNMKEISKPALQSVNDGEINLIPGYFINTYKHWMENVQDWCLSRQLWWGHRIPAYYIQGTDRHVVAPIAEEALSKARTLTGNPELSADHLTQDEDVLDTWASSWLWPMEVFQGISDPGNPDFEYYYPTNELVTAPEILFFWVARMIIAGYEYQGKKPFNNVYLHGIVRDEQRRKMSKSLGNSPDPLDLIRDYGADGVRVGILLSSPAGNDLLFKYDLVEQGRNFANKIWNAFRLVKGWEVADQASSARDTLAIQWMQNRIQAARLEIEDHFSKFRIADALMVSYKLKWDDFCSWFLEMVKPDYGQPIAKDTLESVIQLFEQTLQILHPFMPFITEELWHGLRDRKPGEFICVSALPEAGPVDEAILKETELIKESITALRAFRTEKGIPFKESMDLYLNTDQTELFSKYQALLQKFLNLGALTFTKEKPAQAGSLRVGTHEFYIPLTAVDLDAEKEKIQKEIEYFEGFLKKVNQKLDNERFVSNAPEKVVALEKKKQSDTEAKLEVLRK
ncbi:MAG: class I tRNA ligase family protein, partial [Bacteroidota bacterium]